MADPLTSTLRLTQPTVGGDSGAWGGLINGDLAYIDAGINGILGISINGLTSYTLEAAGDSGDQARYQWYNFTGTLAGNCTVTLPAAQKVGIVSNSTSGGKSVIMTTGSGNTLTIGAGQTFMWYCDGTNVGILPWSTNGVLPAIAVTGNTSLTLAETGSYIEVTSGNPLTITLPTPVSNAGIWYHIYNSPTGTTTLNSGSGNFGGPLGSGATTQTVLTNTDVTVVSDGTTWKVFGQGGAGAFTTLTASSTLNVTGAGSFAAAVTIGGTATISGVANVVGAGTSTMSNLSVLGTLSAGTVQATSTATTLYVSSTSQFVGTSTFSSAIDVLGTATMAVLDVTGTSSHVGSAIFGNVVSIAGSTTNAALTVNGTGTSTLIGGLSVGAGLSGVSSSMSGTATAAVISVTGTSTHAGAAFFGANTTVVGTSTTAVIDVTGTSSLVGAVTMGAGFSAVGTGTAAVMSVTGTSTTAGKALFGAGMGVTGTATIATLDVTGTSTQAGAATFGSTVNATSGLTTLSTATVTAGMNVLGGVTADSVSASTLTASASGLSVTGGATIDTLAVTGLSTQAGITNGASPNAGNIGEFKTNVVSVASLGNGALTLATNGAMALGPGNWFITSDISFNYSGTCVAASLGLSTATTSVAGGGVSQNVFTNTAASIQYLNVSSLFIGTATATLYCMLQANFNSGACAAAGNMKAFRFS